MLNSKGYSLLEILLVLLLSSLIMLGCAQFFFQLQVQVVSTYQRFRLQQMATYLFNNLEKDIQRSGFSTNGYLPDAIKIISTSCIVIGYDFTRHGKEDYFSYRWLGKTLEQKSGEGNCAGSGWENLNDPNEIIVTDFVIKSLSKKITGITLQLELSKNRALIYREIYYVTAFNAG